MVFSDIEFLLYFLPIFFILYGMTPDKYKNMTLLAGSLVFYTFGEPRYLPLLLLSVAANYVIGLHLRVRKKRKGKKNQNKKRTYICARTWLLALAVAGNAGMLLLFKTGAAGDRLPLGISFYTFQMLSYLIDVYRGEIPREESLTNFAVYVTMFPRLTSGPIVNYSEVSESLSKRKMTLYNLQDGLKTFTLGLAAKVLLADRLGILWHEVQVTGFESISTPLAWLGAVAYSLKIYFDFGGYSLMAVGLGAMLGFRLPDNFDVPYMAVTVRDFYRRWHITLGRWFCRYVYIPLGGSRRGELRTVVNLLAVWLLTALWHGFTPNFLLWGLLLWALIAAERQIGNFVRRHSVRGESLWGRMHILPHLYLCAVIPITWMCFAITDMSQLQIYLGRMFHLTSQAVSYSGDWGKALQDYGALLAAAILFCLPLGKKLYHKWKDSLPVSILLAALFWFCVRRILLEGNNPFMYLDF